MARQLLREDDVFSVREDELELTITPDPDAVYYLRPITSETARVISKRHTRQVPNRRTHQKEDVSDRIAISDDILDHAIVRWEGVTDAGKPAPCDLAHKLKLPVEVQAALIERAQAGEGADQSASFRATA